MTRVGIISLVTNDDENRASAGTNSNDSGLDNHLSCDDSPCDCDCDCHDCVAGDD